MIYVCIPTHNEAATVGVLMWKVRKVLGEIDRPFTIVVHDDASTDDTPQVLARYKGMLPLTVIRSEQRLGYGRSVEVLLRHVQAEAPYPKRDCAVVMQADFTEDPKDMVPLVKLVEGGADIVAGCVSGGEGEPPKGTKMVRWVTDKLLKRVLKGAPVSDPLGGLRAYRVIVLKKALRERAESLITSDGWAANVELLGKLAPHARRVAEAPLALRYDLQMRPSRFRPVRTIWALARLGSSLWAAPPSVEAA
ncbi:MAG: glycosyltransferase family 2 protein [Gemmatimonadetes bacterium]|nr:glycosyltransferase family 2 protein [Gemmatimonadota bacterium]